MKRPLLLAALTLTSACRSKNEQAVTPQQTPKPTEATSPVLEVLDSEQQRYVEDIAEFSKTTVAAVRERMKRGSVPLKEEWEKWEKEGAMSPERIKAFYKQTSNYIYELGEWHLFVADKRESDTALVMQMKQAAPKNILDFGGGVGLMALPLAKAGFDVTLADLAGTSLEFAKFRAKKNNWPVKIWQSDLEPMPPDAKYDVILCLDVLEHLPKDELKNAVDKLVKLKHKDTKVIMSAPFGRTSVHPMHLDADDHTKMQVERLKNELPADEQRR